MDSVLVHLGVMLGHLGFKLMVLWPFWLQVGASWSHLDSNLGVLGVILEATRKIDGFLRFPGGPGSESAASGDGFGTLFA